jgi:GNAT superfamily N-acetyltransferase
MGTTAEREAWGVETDGVSVRRAGVGDAGAVAEVWLRSFAAALPGVKRAHTDDEVRWWKREIVLPEQETWVATTAEEAIVGMLVLDGGELEQLYLEPAWRGRGVGDRLVALAKERCPGGLGLWTFQVNESARRFYRRHGFVQVDRTDGGRNEEREPDVRYVWQPVREAVR